MDIKALGYKAVVYHLEKRPTQPEGTKVAFTFKGEAIVSKMPGSLECTIRLKWDLKLPGFMSLLVVDEYYFERRKDITKDQIGDMVTGSYNRVKNTHRDMITANRLPLMDKDVSLKEVENLAAQVNELLISDLQ